MSKILSHTGNDVYIGHFQGDVMKKYAEIVEEFSQVKVKITPRISVITNYTNKDEAITALQLENSCMPSVNACKNTEGKWTNVNKIRNYVDALEQTVSEYSLLVDGYDVLFFKDLGEEFIEKFLCFNKKILFNATKNNYPNFEIDKVENRDLLGEFKYLNAGVVFGKTEDLLAFYKEVLEKTKDDTIRNPWNSEQLYIRIVSNGKDYVSFDNECVLFQTFSKTSKAVCGNTIIIV